MAGGVAQYYISVMFRRAVCLFFAGILMAQTAADPQVTARKVLDLLVAKKYTDIIALISPGSKAAPANSEAGLAKLIHDDWGAMQSVGTADVRKFGTASVVYLPVKFANQNATLVVSFTEQGQIGLIQIQVDPWKHPPYSKPDAFKERDVTVGTQWKLAGTLTVPNGAGPFPGVVLVHDSGAAERDETTGAVKVFKDLAEGLASQGIVVLRYEKRTRTYPRTTQDPDYTADAEIIQDAVLAAAVLRAQPEVKPGRVFELGFGLGGYLMPRIAEADGKLSGMVLVNANERPLEDLALDEAKYLNITGPQMQLIIEQASKIKKLTPTDYDGGALLGMQGPYLLDLKDYNPAGQAKLVAIPMLILQGGRDYQVTMKDFDAWKSGLQGVKNITMKSYPALDHVLVAGAGPSSAVDYRKPGQHIAPEVVDDVAKWLNQ